MTVATVWLREYQWVQSRFFNSNRRFRVLRWKTGSRSNRDQSARWLAHEGHFHRTSQHI